MASDAGRADNFFYFYGEPKQQAVFLRKRCQYSGVLLDSRYFRGSLR